MEIYRQPSESQAAGPEQSHEPSGEVSPELVRQIAERVYALILEDLRIEYERRRWEPGGWPVAGG
jgi:hypothetical protein